MPYATFQQDREYLTNKFRTPIYDTATGMDVESLKAALEAMAPELDAMPRPIAKAKCFRFICDNMGIDVNPHDWFPAISCADRNNRPLHNTLERWQQLMYTKYFRNGTPEAQELFKTLCDRQCSLHTCWLDFDHSVPDWQAIFTLGFPGLRDRAKAIRAQHEKNGTLTPEARDLFDGIDATICAAIDTIGRFIDYARSKHPDDPRIQQEIACLEQLRIGPPRTTYEALQIIYLQFIFCEHVSHMQVRSLGNLDQELLPYYERDIKNGTTTEALFREQLACFLMQWGSINNYWGQPVYFGGTNADGSTQYNYFMHIILDVFDKLAIPTPKFQLKVADNTPQDILDHAFDMIRRGHNSIVFCGEQGMRHAMMGMGLTAEQARTCFISGCYEFSPLKDAVGSGAGHVNLLKPVELVFNDGTDLKTGYVCNCNAAKLADIHSFEDFYQAYLAYLRDIVDVIIRYSLLAEAHSIEVNPAAMFSITMEGSLKRGMDAFSGGCKYNSSVILACGLGTTVDALFAVKHFVFDTHEITLEQFRDILKADWQGHEKLRLKALRLKQKYGNGIQEVDEFAAGLAHYVATLINGRPNARNGMYFTSGHCAKQFVIQGENTAATPDGRHAGDEFSKNLSPTMGMDVNGVTALVKSVCAIDSADLPGDFPLDIMLHPATVKGDEGLAAMRAILQTFFHKNGCAIHFNVFDAAVLEDAQAHPEKYEGLQIRVCGWNTHFTTMSKKEQDAYIERAKNISE